ncbi:MULTISPECIES: hypothetical protein [unclassified Streptomyces]|uniref:hypothetical protein n=1 Tax=unclassified Streptomyces TaxID=2593676 RepID=UPI0011B93896|nr:MULTISPECIES: hypothetical protein [unclassified Streptomyces]MYT70023.1 hypothetical protein [Streptomyces sp. SID8367]
MSAEESVQRRDLLDLIERCDLVQVNTQECHAVRHSSSNPVIVNVSLGSEMSPGDDRVDYRFTMTSEMVTGEQETVAELKVVMVARFSISEGAAAGEAVLSAFGNEVATMVVYPYVRQQTQDLAGRIGLPNLTLGLMKRDDGKQVAASLDLLLGT